MADLAIINAKAWTADRRQPWAQAVAVRGERIAAVGADKEIRPWIGGRTRVIDAGGRLVLPGFDDAHAHFFGGGFSLLDIALRSARDEQDFVEKIRQFVAGAPKGRWITGGRWDHEAWPSRKRPTRALIDGVTPDHPVFLRRLDGHIAVANTLALKLAGVTRDTPDPSGGTIERDPRTGEPTGILIDRALGLVSAVIPEPTQADNLAAARAAMQHAVRLGVTSVQSPSTVGDFRALQELRRNGELTVRVYVALPVSRWKEMHSIGIQPGFGDPMLRVGAVKIFADGSLGARSALFFAPYEDDPSTSGLAMWPEEELCRVVGEVDRSGLQVFLHAIGDKAVHWALNAFERAAEKNGRRDARHRVEHAQAIQPADRARFAQLGVVASIQPSHCIDDMRWIEKRLGRRCEIAYPYRSLLDAGARIALGTDWYVEPLDPMLGLYAAVTREFPGGGPPGGWYPAEKVALEKAVEDYTLGSAFAEFQEREKGSIEVGKLADMVILSQDLFTIPPREILNTKVDATVLGGRVVYERGGTSGL